MTDPLACICDRSPRSDGPDQGCPQHGDVRWYSQMWAEANAEIERLQTEADLLREWHLQRGLADGQALHPGGHQWGGQRCWCAHREDHNASPLTLARNRAKEPNHG